jgi:hypothetical protein
MAGAVQTALEAAGKFQTLVQGFTGYSADVQSAIETIAGELNTKFGLGITPTTGLMGAVNVGSALTTYVGNLPNDAAKQQAYTDIEAIIRPHKDRLGAGAGPLLASLGLGGGTGANPGPSGSAWYDDLWGKFLDRAGDIGEDLTGGDGPGKFVKNVWDVGVGFTVGGLGKIWDATARIQSESGRKLAATGVLVGGGLLALGAWKHKGAVIGIALVGLVLTSALSAGLDDAILPEQRPPTRVLVQNAPTGPSGTG